MICPFCKAEVSDHANFCTVCGKKIPRDAAVTDGLQAPASGVSGQFSGNADEGFRQAEAGQSTSGSGRSPNTNTDPKLVEALKGINTMNVLQIICLVLLFIPIVNILGSILLLIILIVSLGLAGKVSAVFNQYGYPLYAGISDRVRTYCLFMLIVQIASVTALCIFSGIQEVLRHSNPVILLVCVCVVSTVMLIVLFFQIYCFCRLYTVKGALETISFGYPLPPKPSSGGLITGIILAIVFIIVVLVGIVAAIALPAYARYMERARFTEVVSVADGIKKQAELCFADRGETGVEGVCDNAHAANGNGWALLNPEDYRTKYVESVTVSSTNADNSRSGRAEATITVNGRLPKRVGITIIGTWNNGRMEWRTDPYSSCKAEKLC